MDINEWTADQCGIEVDYAGETLVMVTPDSYGTLEWNYHDPRCREIIREHFKIDTEYLGRSEVWAASHAHQKSNPFVNMTQGKTIAEAEIACIEAIHTAENE